VAHHEVFRLPGGVALDRDDQGSMRHSIAPIHCTLVLLLETAAFRGGRVSPFTVTIKKTNLGRRKASAV
jgi:hypothetical protein